MGFIQEKIYPHLPVPMQNIAISAFGYIWYKRRFSGLFDEQYRGFKERENYSEAQWNQYQTRQTRQLLMHAFESVPFYRSGFSKAGFTKEKLQAFELNDFPKLPILEKDELRRFGKSSLLSSIPEANGEFFRSSGSTGTPTNIMYSTAMHQRLSALYEARVRNFAGVSRHDSRGMIGGRRIIPSAIAKPPYYRYNFVEKQLYLSAYHLGKHTVKNYVNGIVKYRPMYLVGYAMSNYTLAYYIKEGSLKVPPMKAVLTSSEKLTSTMRKTISDVYQCKVYDAWSGVEWCGLISENEYSQLLISPDSAYIEIIKPNGEHAKPGESGELVCTGFLNSDQPLIRYRIGDVAKLAADQQTKCGRAFPVIEEIVGRSEDVISAEDGRQMVRFHGIFVDLPNVLKGQIVQEDLTSFTINVATQGLTIEEKSAIKNRMESQLGKISLCINEMEDIPTEASGKFKAVISKLPSTQFTTNYE